MDSSPILRKKPSTILVLLKDANQKWHLSKLAKQSKSTYVYVTGLMKKFQKEGIVLIKQEGRNKVVTLTEKGAAISSAIESLLAKLSPPSSQQPEQDTQKGALADSEQKQR